MSNLFTVYICYVTNIAGKRQLLTETWENQTSANFCFNRSNQLLANKAVDMTTNKPITGVISSWYNKDMTIAKAKAIDIAKAKLAAAAAPTAPTAVTAPTATTYKISWTAKKQHHEIICENKEFAESTADALRASGHAAKIEEVQA